MVTLSRGLFSLFLFTFGSANSCGQTRHSLHTVADVCAEGTSTLHDALLSANGRIVACIGEDASVAFNIRGTVESSFLAESIAGDISQAVLSNDGQFIATWSGTRIYLRSVQTGKQLEVDVPGDFTLLITNLSFSPDGRVIAVSSGVLYHMNLHVFDTVTGELLGQPLLDVDGIASDIVFSPNGTGIAVNHWSTLYVVDAIRYKTVSEVTGRTSAVYWQGEQLIAVADDSLQLFKVGASGHSGESSGQFMSGAEDAMDEVIFAARAPVAVFLRRHDVVVRDSKQWELFRLDHQNDPVDRIRISADGKTVLLIRESRKVQLVEIR